MISGTALAALGVLAVAGIERIDLPPAAVRAIAAALPFLVLFAGVVLLFVGALLARLATREAERVRGGAAGLAPGQGAGALRELRASPAAGSDGAAEAAAPRRDRAT
jgi:hypothetical protein